MQTVPNPELAAQLRKVHCTSKGMLTWVAIVFCNSWHYRIFSLYGADCWLNLTGTSNLGIGLEAHDFKECAA